MADHIGRRIASLRRSKRITQAELESQAGLALTAVSKIEKGTREVTTNEARMIARVLRVDIHQLFHETETEEVGVCAALVSVRRHCSLRQRRAIAGLLQSLVQELVPSGSLAE